MQGTTQYAVRDHGNWSHGLRPGTSHDMNCGACQAESVTEQASAGPVTAPVRHSQRQRRAWADVPEWVDPGSPVRYLAAQRER